VLEDSGRDDEDRRGQIAQRLGRARLLPWRRDCPTRSTALLVDSFLTALDVQRTAYSAQQQLVTTRLNRASDLVELCRLLVGGLR
jgi:hypothetical protein